MQSEVRNRSAVPRPGVFGRLRGRMACGLMLAALAGAVVAGCGSSNNSSSSGGSSSTGSSSSSGSGSPSSSGVAHAKAVVAKYSAPITSYDLPTVPIKNVSSLKGKTVMYIPLINAIPAFQIVAGSMTTALAKVGVKVTQCNGGATPTVVAACIQRAIGSHMAGIVTDAIPYEMASNAFNSAAKAGIPVVIADQYPESHGSKIAYQAGNTNQPTLMADWIIADSNGKANAIVEEETDSPSATQYITNGLVPEFKKYCPNCKVKLLKETAASNSQAVAQVNSAVLQDPNVQYFYTEFEDALQNTLQGLQQAGKIGSIRAEAATATIFGLGKMKAKQAVYAEVGDDVNYEAWADADEILRMMAKQPVVTENIPERIFDRSNINSIQLSNAAQASGAWYGPSSFETGFEKLWGV